ncbi:polyprenyl synthetase family protein [Georgenia sunbinii]|uniref:polyprenyl synthetase family protein n=1 Tax=Georgenia sunbinii TaxID=3117728 RepID=UPI002F266233
MLRDVREAGLERTEAALARFFAAGDRQISSADHRRLWTVLQESTAGGKRFRPALFHSVYLALGGRDTDVAAEVAAALELLHTALVVHDDVIDGDTVRRGRPNVSGTFAADARGWGTAEDRAAHYGDTAAILAGDLALAGAVRTVALCGAPAPVVRRLLDVLDDAIHRTAAGELTDVRLSIVGGDDIAETIAMEQQKTAVYSFELPLRLAAVLAGTEPAEEAALGNFARLIGVAYQLGDDLDGMFGDQTTTGKSTLSDLRGGKTTPLISYARTTAAWPAISPYLHAGTVDEEDVARVRDLLELCGARAFVADLVQEMAASARNAVAHLAIAPLLEDWVHAVVACREGAR